MANPLVTKKPDINQLYQEFIKNPTQFLTGLNIPKELTTPEQMVKYLFDNGKIPPMLQAKVNAMLNRH